MAPRGAISVSAYSLGITAKAGHRVQSFIRMKADLPDYSDRPEWRHSSKGAAVIFFILFVSA
jgi:hypothetical protein